MEWIYAYAFFVIYAFLGWICEDIYCGIPAKKFINRGFLYGPYCPIYGVGAVCVLYPLLLIGNNPILVFVVGMFITSCLEYVTSWAMEKLFHTRWWDYSHYKFHINGRVCLLNSTLFGVMCLVLIFFVHPHIQNWVYSIPNGTLFILLGIFTILFAIDETFTVINLIKRMKLIDKVHDELVELHEQFEVEKAEFLQESTEIIESMKTEAYENFMEWTESRDELIEKTKEIHEKLQAILYSHISKAFPRRVILPRHEHIKEWKEYRKSKNNK